MNSITREITAIITFSLQTPSRKSYEHGQISHDIPPNSIALYSNSAKTSSKTPISNAIGVTRSASMEVSAVEKAANFSSWKSGKLRRQVAPFRSATIFPVAKVADVGVIYDGRCDRRTDCRDFCEILSKMKAGGRDLMHSEFNYSNYCQ